MGNVPVNVADSGVDFYTFSGHKWILGPKRTGILYVREDRMEELQPITIGAYSDDGYVILKNELKFNSSAQRYEYARRTILCFTGWRKP